MTESGHSVTRAQFEENLQGKQTLRDFREDMNPLLRPGLSWDIRTAMNVVRDRFVALVPGDPWKGSAQP
ncbi:hypothetical protein [Candidatus Palauibacter sp.]|uniref:hypothetical protein n=1 Tax=Candidatus Palauibacter sp. TaxID=3101350 RepID=UPI003B51B8CD